MKVVSYTKHIMWWIGGTPYFAASSSLSHAGKQDPERKASQSEHMNAMKGQGLRIDSMKISYDRIWLQPKNLRSPGSKIIEPNSNPLSS